MFDVFVDCFCLKDVNLALLLYLCPTKLDQRVDELSCSFVSLYHREGLVEALCRPATL